VNTFDRRFQRSPHPRPSGLPVRQGVRTGRGAATGVGHAAMMALALALLGGCRAEDAADRTRPVVVGVHSDFDAFNPLVTTSAYGQELNNFALFTPLIQHDEDLSPMPWLAESWTLEGDTAVVFQLRQDVYWHDGRLVTAEDVAFTFERAKDPATASLLGSVFLVDVATARVEAPHRIRFGFHRPHAQALESFWWAPVPMHVLEGVSAAELRTAAFNRNPVGSGPFRLETWDANQRVVLARNPDFPAALGGPAAAERVVFRIVPEATTLLTELLTGAVHVNIPVFPDQVPIIEASASATVHAFPGRGLLYLGWNNERPPFDDPEVRRALALSVDRRGIIDGLLGGLAEPAAGTIPPGHPLHPTDVEPLPYAPDEAARLLDAAGWTDRDGDGVRDKDGRPLRFTLLTSDDPLRRAIAQALQSQFRTVGVALDLRVLEFQTMLQLHRDRDFDAVLSSWVLDNFQMAAAPRALLHSSQADVPRSANRSGVRIAELDRLIDRGGTPAPRGELRAVWSTFTRILQEQQPLTFLFWPHELAASGQGVEGVVMDQRGELRSIARWRVGG